MRLQYVPKQQGYKAQGHARFVHANEQELNLELGGRAFATSSTRDIPNRAIRGDREDGINSAGRTRITTGAELFCYRPAPHDTAYTSLQILMTLQLVARLRRNLPSPVP